MKKHILFIFFCLYGSFLFSQNIVKPLDKIDVLKYTFYINVNDTTNVIAAQAIIDFKLLKQPDTISLNLVNKDISDKGMQVFKVLYDTKNTAFKQDSNFLNINVLNKDLTRNHSVNIFYKGIPKDGLIISKNKYGDRTFFGDNWPNRARNWLPCIDYLADKAYVEFFVSAPSKYNVVANGSLKKNYHLTKGFTIHHWQSSVPLPTDVMVIGVAQFAVQNLKKVNGIPISSWVYPQNKKEGFYDYAQARDILKYYIHLFGPYPYKKLANVQSKTRFGGMENASNIFYSEKSVTGKRDQESLLAHEIVHQWFGDSATEKDWPHLWLSEGFATYFTNVYLEHKFGKSKLDNILQQQRQKIIAFSKKWQKPVVDMQTKNLMRLLNANSYQKGGWFLHMLRRKIGDKLFFKSIRTYYKTYKFKNADTRDFQRVVEQVSGKNLTLFFNQWLYRIGQPKLAVVWGYNHKKISINLSQIQKNTTFFKFPLAVKFVFKDNTFLLKTFNISKKENTFSFTSDKAPWKIILDPKTDLLFEDISVKQ
ncbi:MAG: M1 family metallopeptidase [Flavobacteriaceae bacterium]